MSVILSKMELLSITEVNQLWSKARYDPANCDPSTVEQMDHKERRPALRSLFYTFIELSFYNL